MAIKPLEHQERMDIREQVEDLRKELLDEGLPAGKINPHINQFYDRLIILLEMGKRP